MMRKDKFFFYIVRQLAVVIAVTIIVVFMSSCSNGKVDVSEEIHLRINKIQQSIDYSASSEISASSNLYDNVKSNEDFEVITDLGFAALPELIQLLDQSEQDGVKEYIYAVALEQISKVDMRKRTDWNTGKEFLTIYTAYLKEIPNKVKSIVDETINDTEKVDQLKLLGTPAIPYLFDVIDSGHKELAPAFNYLTDNESKGDVREWGIKNVDQLNLLINLVEQQ